MFLNIMIPYTPCSRISIICHLHQNLRNIWETVGGFGAGGCPGSCYTICVTKTIMMMIIMMVVLTMMMMMVVVVMVMMMMMMLVMVLLLK